MFCLLTLLYTERQANISELTRYIHTVAATAAYKIHHMA